MINFQNDDDDNAVLFTVDGWFIIFYEDNEENEDSDKKLTFLSPLMPSSTGWMISAT